MQGRDSLVVNFTAYPAGSDTAGLVFYWDFDGDGVSDLVGSDEETPSWTYAPGYYSVSLAITNGAQEGAAVFKSAYIWVSAAEIYVWSGGSGYPGTSWANAFTNIQDAFDFASGGNNIYLAGEIFDLSAELIWASMHDVQILGGYEALATTVGPGPFNAAEWPTILRRTPRDSRIMSASFVTDALMARVTITGGNTPVDSAKAFGGGLSVLHSGLDVLDCVFTNNQANASGNGHVWGGGLYAQNSTLTVRRSRFERNIAKSTPGSNNNRAYGGALAAEGSAIYVSECVFGYNDADAQGHYGSWGGAVYTIGGSALIRNALFIGNRAGTTRSLGEGGAVYLSAGAIIENCTIVANACYGNIALVASGAGGIYNNGISVTNCIVWANTNSFSTTISDFGAANSGNVAYTCASELDDGVNGNITSDPLLLLVAGKRPQYSLGDASPCINAGIRLSWMETATDLAGNRRVSGGAADMGCYEKPAAAATILMLR